MLGLTPDAAAPTPTNLIDPSKVGITNEHGEIVDGLSNFEREVIRQHQYAPLKVKSPKGYQNMTQRTSRTPLGILWVQLCAAEGSASSILYAAEPKDLSEDDKVKLMTTFFRLRAKGYSAAGISKLCPRAILKAEPQEALSDLPKVTEPDPQDHHQWGEIAARANLGLL